MPRQTKTVSERSTKQDILSAYEELLTHAEDKPMTPGIISQIEKVNKTALNDLDGIVGKLQSATTATFDELRMKLENAENALTELYKLREAQKKQLSEEKETAVKEQNREKEEFGYEFAKMKKRAEEELAEMRMKAEIELAARREKLKEQEEELTDLRNQAKTFEPRLQKSINDAVAQVTKELKQAFDHEKALLTQEAKSTQSLLEQKVVLLEQTINRQTEEISRLNQTATSANQQLTRIAERAVTKSPEPTTTPQSKI